MYDAAVLGKPKVRYFLFVSSHGGHWISVGEILRLKTLIKVCTVTLASLRVMSK